MKQRIAVFQSKYGDSIFNESMESFTGSNYSRLTQYVEVDFPELPIETVVGNQVASINQQIDEIKNKAMEEVAALQTRKAELLALTHEVAA